MHFFDTTPNGSIMTRFTHDVDRTMYPLTLQMNSYFAAMSWILGGIGTTAAFFPQALPHTLFLLACAFYFLYRFRAPNAHLQRLDAMARSSLNGMILESLEGAVTLRAMKKMDNFLEYSKKEIERSSAAIDAFSAAQRWIGIRAEILGGLIIPATSLLAWILRDSTDIALTVVPMIWTLIMYKCFTLIIIDGIQGEAKLVSVQRLIEYNELSQEAAPNPDADPKGPWPAVEAVELHNLHLRYRPELPLALNGASAKIRAGSRVGIVGRTGAGKSSIAVALFRLRELLEGTITIDGIDISALSLSALRGGRMAAVPQDPVLFAGTIRSNLDPGSAHTDEEIQTALDHVGMWTLFEKADGLRTSVGDHGGDFSSGQRQLICIARALLRKPSVLVLDEATANVDHDADQQIQRIVREEFKGCTIIEIAHRLQTVMDADEIIVLDNGKVCEMGPPSVLLENPNGVFSSLVQAGNSHHASSV